MPFICTADTVFEGRVATWRDDDGKPCLYETYEAALADCDVADDDSEGPEEVVVTPTSIVDAVDGRIYWEATTGTEGQDRKSYTDDQDRKGYT